MASRNRTYKLGTMNVEVYDLSIPTGQNEPGSQKLTDGLLNGINPTLSTPIEELNIIINADPNDIKVHKRIMRRDFLELCDRSS